MFLGDLRIKLINGVASHSVEKYEKISSCEYVIRMLLKNRKNRKKRMHYNNGLDNKPTTY